MKFLEKVQGYLKLRKDAKVLKPEKGQKLLRIMDFIDDVYVNESNNSIHIKTKGNILIENNGHVVNFTKGINVQIADTIHLNPLIKFNKTTGFDTLDEDLKKAQEVLLERINKERY